MFPVISHPLPDDALLAAYRQKGAYTDCYVADVARAVALPQYVRAFYTTGLFRLERAILARVVSRPSTDAQAKLLSEGVCDNFAAWHVEGRCDDQLLMCDFQHRTRSWFMVEPFDATGGVGTRLYFGSAVVPRRHDESGKPVMGAGFHAVVGFHKCYSVALLNAARSRLMVRNGHPAA